MFYPDDLIEEIRIQNDIVDVLSQYVKLNKKGSSYFGLCPFHNEKTPSFSVSEDKQIYHCFGCGAGGNVITFMMEYENYSFVETIKALASRVNISLPEPEVSEEVKKKMQYKQHLYEANKEAARFFYTKLHSDVGKKAFDYLENRGIDKDIRKKFGIGFATFFRDDLYKYLREKSFSDQVILESGLVQKDKNKENAFYDRFFNRVMFPIIDIHNRIIGFGGRVLDEKLPKYLNSPETKLFDKSKNLYGLNIARTSRKNNIILVEGYMDVISLHQAGFDNTVASLGTAFTQGHANLLKRYTNEVILSYDNDSAGKKASLKAIPILEAVGLIVRVLKLGNYKDPDDFIKGEGSEAFEGLIHTSTPSFMFEIEQLEEGYTLSNPDHKTSFFQEVAKRLIGIENEIKRDSYVEAILQVYPINAKALNAEMERLGKDIGIVTQARREVSSKPMKNRKEKDAVIVAQKNILTFMVSHRDIYEAIYPHIKPAEFIDDLYKQAAEIIVNLYKENLSIQPSMIINKFFEVEEQNKVANIFNNDIKVENQLQFEKIINESLQILKGAYIDKRVGQITDINELQELIKAKRELQDLYISLNHG